MTPGNHLGCPTHKADLGATRGRKTIKRKNKEKESFFSFLFLLAIANDGVLIRFLQPRVVN